MHQTLQEDGYLYSRGHAWRALFLIYMLMLFDFIDRQVLSALLPYIKVEWQLSDTELGALVGIVNVAIALFAFPVSVLVDRWSRTKSISGMAVLWSAATVACAFAGNFAQMLVGRFFIGTGEAGYTAGGASLLSASFPRRLRGTVMGIANSATMLGSVLGVVLGGAIAAKWGWRYAFGVVAIPGFVFAILILFLRDYKNVHIAVQPHQDTQEPGMSWQQATRVILRSGALRAIFVGSAMQLMFTATVGNWLPSYFNRYHALAPDQAGLRTGIMLLIASVGVMAFGYLSDKLAAGKPRRRLVLMASFPLCTALAFGAAFALPVGNMQLGLLFVGAFFMAAILGPCFAVIHDLVHPGMTGMAIGVLILANNLLGMALGPLIGGMLSDRFELSTALLLVSAVPLTSAAAFFLASTRYDKAIAALTDTPH
ncbi:MAG: MFS transporter [Pseudomonadota bacterium]